jgi:hypothetical protein
MALSRWTSAWNSSSLRAAFARASDTTWRPGAFIPERDVVEATKLILLRFSPFSDVALAVQIWGDVVLGAQIENGTTLELDPVMPWLSCERW